MKKNQYKTALYFSDIVGYSKMIGNNEELTLSLLNEHDAILIESIQKYSGSIIKHIGDAIFAKFNFIDDAIHASIEIQKNLNHRNKTQKKHKQIKVRIGLHEGNIIEKNNDLFGHHVNICSRIEGTAIPCSIAISKQALNNSKLDNITRSYGYVKLKNIKEPIEIVRIYHANQDYLKENPSDFKKLLMDRGIQTVDIDSFISEETNSVAFLYPQNIGNENDEFFCYSFLEQIIQDLQNCNDLRVSNIFDIQKYKKSFLSPNDIARELNVDNLVQSNIMKVGNKFKISVQLVSLDDGEVILQKTYDGLINDLKKVSGKITINILDKFEVSTDKILYQDLDRELKIDKDAYELFLRGRYLCNHIKSKKDYIEAQRLLEKAIQIEDNFSEAYAFNGIASMRIGHFEDAEENFDIALEIARDNNDLFSLSTVYNFLGIYYKIRGYLRKAVRNFEKGLKIHKETNNKIKEFNILNNLADCYSKMNKNQQAIELIKRIIPEYIDREEFEYLANSYGNLGNAYKNMGRLTDALEYYNKSIGLCVKTGLYISQAQNLIIMADIYNQIGFIDESKDKLSKLEDIIDKLKNELIYGRYKAALSRMYLNSNDLINGIKFLENAIIHFQNSNNNALVVRYLLELTLIFIQNDMIDKGESKLNQAIILLENNYRNSRFEILAEYYKAIIQFRVNKNINNIKKIINDNDNTELFKISCLFFKQINDLDNFNIYKSKWNDAVKLNSKNIFDERQRKSYLKINIVK